MKAKFYGITMSVRRTRKKGGEGKPSLAAFFEHLAGKSDQPLKASAKSPERLIYVAKDGDYHIGLLVSIRSEKAFLTLKREDGKMIVTPKLIEENSDGIDLNFFVVHRDTGRGLYSHAKSTCAPSTFGLFMRSQYTALRRQRIDAFQQATKATGTKADAEFDGVLECTTMTSVLGLADLMNEIIEFDEFRFDVTQPKLNEDVYEPAKPQIKLVRTTVRLTETRGHGGRVVGMIQNVMKSFQPDKGLIRGRDHAGNTQKITIDQKSRDNYGEYEWDKVLMATFDVHDFAQADLLRQLLKICREDPASFEYPETTS